MIIEACAGSVVIREIDAELDVSRYQLHADKLFLQGAFAPLEEDMLRVMLGLCTPYVIDKKQLIGIADIWKEEFTSVCQGGAEFSEFYKSEIKNQTVPLAGGWWFDGSSYLDFYGNRRECHPNIAIIVEHFCDYKNKDYRKFNELLEEVSCWLV